ncbi:MAG: DUF3288 family protein [Leptolyngbya sp. DLM2.Bin15]|nr:MAG: DUF3288 family protein [Leptolyngbya sp. DLM2.Bin15]
MANDQDRSNEQQHPLWGRDRETVMTLIQGEPTDLNLVELARLRIRYHGFPGARDIQADLEKVMHRWQLTEESLFEKTRQIHAMGSIYRGRSNRQDDWS